MFSPFGSRAPTDELRQKLEGRLRAIGISSVIEGPPDGQCSTKENKHMPKSEIIQDSKQVCTVYIENYLHIPIINIKDCYYKVQ